MSTWTKDIGRYVSSYEGRLLQRIQVKTKKNRSGWARLGAVPYLRWNGWRKERYLHQIFDILEDFLPYLACWTQTHITPPREESFPTSTASFLRLFFTFTFHFCSFTFFIFLSHSPSSAFSYPPLKTSADIPHPPPEGGLPYFPKYHPYFSPWNPRP